MVKPAPETLACEIVTLADPVFERLTDAEPLLPTTTFPKLTAEGVLVRLPGCAPEPVNATENGEFEALLVIAKLPVTPPADCGAN
jgi:hypothetical protein